MADFTVGALRKAGRFAALHGPPDVVIGSSPHPYVFVASHRIARRFGAVSIFEVRDLWPLSLIELAGVSRLHPLVTATSWLEHYAYRRADHVVSLHPNTLQHMEQRGLTPSRWTYIPNGIDVEEVPVLDPEEPAYQRLRAWQAEGRFVVLYAGALGPPNNIDILIQAGLKAKRQGNPSLRILIVGRGESQAALSDMVEALDLSDTVALYPQVPKSHALALMEAADAGYISLKPMPIFRHGISPNKLYDYMYAKLPVVSAIEAANDPVSDAECGITVPPGDPDAVVKALSQLAGLSKRELVHMGQRGRDYVSSHHDYSVLAQAYARLFMPSDALGTHKSSSVGASRG